MIIGILSDSHGRAERTRLAVDMLIERSADLLLHLGDFETIETIEALAGFNARIVFGNCDDASSLGRYAESIGVIVDHPAGELEIDGKRIIFTHGHIAAAMQHAVSSGAEYLLHGHSHLVRDERIEGTRIINPGALHRASRYTAALLEPGSGRLEIIEVPRSPGSATIPPATRTPGPQT